VINYYKFVEYDMTGFKEDILMGIYLTCCLLPMPLYRRSL